jgi:hypothetical protein
MASGVTGTPDLSTALRLRFFKQQQSQVEHLMNKSDWLEEYEGFTRGDTVRVAGMRGDFQWINAHLLNGVLESYTVLQSGTGMRSFIPERITKKKAKKK